MDTGFVMDSPVGRLGIRTRAGKIVGLDYAARGKITAPLSDPFSKRIKREIKAYFADANSTFELPLELRGTVFQLKVWQALQRIPAGRTLSYGQLAARLHTSPRAVGNACRANPIPLIVPCHRVVASNGIGGFAGAIQGGPIARKRWLLRHEGAIE